MNRGFVNKPGDDLHCILVITIAANGVDIAASADDQCAGKALSAACKRSPSDVPETQNTGITR